MIGLEMGGRSKPLRQKLLSSGIGLIVSVLYEHKTIPFGNASYNLRVLNTPRET